ncbi:MAG TPA: phosphonate C-P lyase system protein PhnH [Candidatus Elarobacter sp.]|jgi:alpha-D-ribose 1-methylphosphonate 5-triphosphate synthase subunit PhnH
MIARVETIHTAQRTFRALLDAVAYPGRVTPIVDLPAVPAGLSPALGACARTLFDPDVAVWVAGVDGGAAAWLRDETGARIVREPAAAQFVVITDLRDVAPLGRWNAGTVEDPETSATLLVQVDALSGGRDVVLAGPGIEDEIVIAPHGLDAQFWDAWAVNAARYPLGVDLFLFDPRAVAGVPRTVRATPR